MSRLEVSYRIKNSVKNIAVVPDEYVPLDVTSLYNSAFEEDKDDKHLSVPSNNTKYQGASGPQISP